MSDAGTSVVEMAIVTLILGVVVSVGLSLLVSATRTSARTTNDLQLETDAQLVLRTLTEDVRGAAPLATAPPSTTTCPSSPTFANCLSLTIDHTSNSATPTCPRSIVTYGLSGNKLMEDRTDYSGSSCSTAKSIYSHKVLLSNVDSSNSSFTYYAKGSGAVLDPSAVVGGALSNVGSVAVTLSLTYSSASGTQTVRPLSSVAALRNDR